MTYSTFVGITPHYGARACTKSRHWHGHWPRPTVHSGPQHSACNYRGCYSTRHTPLRQRSVCSSCSPRAGHGGQVVVARGHGMAGYANYRHGADRCSMAGTGGGRILENLHRCVSPPSGATAAWQCFVRYWLVGTLCVDSTDPFSHLIQPLFSHCEWGLPRRA